VYDLLSCSPCSLLSITWTWYRGILEVNSSQEPLSLANPHLNDRQKTCLENDVLLPATNRPVFSNVVRRSDSAAKGTKYPAHKAELYRCWRYVTVCMYVIASSLWRVRDATPSYRVGIYDLIIAVQELERSNILFPNGLDEA